MPKEVKAKVREKAVGRYRIFEMRYGRRGAKVLLSAVVALAPVPVPGTMFAPVALAEAVLAVRRWLKKREPAGYGVSMSLDGLNPEALADAVVAFIREACEAAGEACPEISHNEALRVAEDVLAGPDAALAIHHAPKGGITIKGTRYDGGQFIPEEVVREASEEERERIVSSGHKQGGLFDRPAEEEEEEPPAEKPKAEDEPAPPEPKRDEPTGQKRAKVGGEYGPNGEWYEGGRWIATQDIPKKQKEKLRKAASGKVQVEGYQWEVPEPGQMAILHNLGGTVLNPRDGSINYNYLEYMKYSADEVAEFEEVVRRWKAGERWIKVTEFPRMARFADLARMQLAGMDVPGRALEASGNQSGQTKEQAAESLGVNTRDSKGSASLATSSPKGEKGRWITIGAVPGEDGKKHGGSVVYIENGRITKGAPSLTGRKIDALKEEAEPTSHRQDVARERAHARASWAKKARQENLDPAELHQLAADVVAHDAELVESRRALLKRAREQLAHYGYDARALTTNLRSGRVEDDIPALDVVADSLSQTMPEQFAGHPDAAERLKDLLTEGNPQPVSEDDAYAQAFDQLQWQATLEAEVPEGLDDDEEIPFSHAGG
jgi:hypothetical protein